MLPKVYIQDPFLVDYLSQFRYESRLLATTGGKQHQEAAARLCELSRKILLLTIPVSDHPPEKVRETVGMLRAASAQIQAGGDALMEKYKGNILARAERLENDIPS